MVIANPPQVDAAGLKKGGFPPGLRQVQKKLLPGPAEALQPRLQLLSLQLPEPAPLAKDGPVLILLPVLLGRHAKRFFKAGGKIFVFGEAALIGNRLEALLVLQQQCGGLLHPRQIQKGPKADSGAVFHNMGQMIGADMLGGRRVLHLDGLVVICIDVVADPADTAQLHLVVPIGLVELRVALPQVVALELPDEDTQDVVPYLPQHPKVCPLSRHKTGKLLFQIAAQNLHAGAVALNGAVGKLIRINIGELRLIDRQVYVEQQNQILRLLNGLETVQLIGAADINIPLLHAQHVVHHCELHGSLQGKDDLQHILVHVIGIRLHLQHGGLQRRSAGKLHIVVQHILPPPIQCDYFYSLYHRDASVTSRGAHRFRNALAAFPGKRQKYVVFWKIYPYNRGEHAARFLVCVSRTLAKTAGAFAPHTLFPIDVVQCFVVRCI